MVWWDVGTHRQYFALLLSLLFSNVSRIGFPVFIPWYTRLRLEIGRKNYLSSGFVCWAASGQSSPFYETDTHIYFVKMPRSLRVSWLFDPRKESVRKTKRNEPAEWDAVSTKLENDSWSDINCFLYTQIFYFPKSRVIPFLARRSSLLSSALAFTSIYSYVRHKSMANIPCVSKREKGKCHLTSQSILSDCLSTFHSRLPFLCVGIPGMEYMGSFCQ